MNKDGKQKGLSRRGLLGVAAGLAAALPLIGFVYENYGFDTLFKLMASAAAVIFVAVMCLPSRLPAPAVVAA